MDMNQPAKANPLDQNRGGLIGKPIDRVDGRLKVTGQAPYAYEVHEGARPAYGYLLEASVAKGRIASIDASAAERASGVIMVMPIKMRPNRRRSGRLMHPTGLPAASRNWGTTPFSTMANRLPSSSLKVLSRRVPLQSWCR